MTFAVVSNILTMMLCIAVLIQSVRLMRAFDAVKGGALTDVVSALDSSTAEAQRVLDRLTDLLRGDIAITARTFSEGKAMIDELAVMTGIGNAIAERILDAAGTISRSAPDAGPTPHEPAIEPAHALPADVLPAPMLVDDTTGAPAGKAPRRPRRAKQAAGKVAA